MVIVFVLLTVSVLANIILAIQASDWRSETKRIKGTNDRLYELIERLQDEPPTPTCQCDHAYSFHKNGKCQYRADPRSGDILDYVFGKCKCQGYVGPEPLPEYYHPLALEQ